jgi:hypothetical protein
VTLPAEPTVVEAVAELVALCLQVGEVLGAGPGRARSAPAARSRRSRDHGASDTAAGKDGASDRCPIPEGLGLARPSIVMTAGLCVYDALTTAPGDAVLSTAGITGPHSRSSLRW